MQDYIGRYVKSFESGKKGSSCLDQCGYDYGLSCGSYQLTLRWGNCIDFLKRFFPRESSMLYFNSNEKDFPSKTWPGRHYCSSPEEVAAVWRKCIEKVGEEDFFFYEHKYIKEKYYDKICFRLMPYLDLRKSCRAFQEMMWSYSVNAGVTGAQKGFLEAINKIGNKWTSEQLFDEIYDIRARSKKASQRYTKEKKDSEREVLRPLLYHQGFGIKQGNYIVTGSSVNIRALPDKESEVRQIVHAGDQLRIILEKGEWANVEGKGWISKKYIGKTL